MRMNDYQNQTQIWQVSWNQMRNILNYDKYGGNDGKNVHNT